MPIRRGAGRRYCLFFSPMAETKLGDGVGLNKERAMPEHWELVGLCLEYNLRHLKKLHKFYSERMTSGPAIHAALTAVNLLSDVALRKYLNRMRMGEPPN